MRNRFVDILEEYNFIFKGIKTVLSILGLIFITLILSIFIYGYFYIGNYEAGNFEGDGTMLRYAKHNSYLGYVSENRGTINKCGDDSAIRIFTFGGSTMWGLSVSDEDTIASNISKILCEKGFNVEVSNYGQLGYVSTQETLYLIKLLRDNNPDIVVFYDGVNDPLPQLIPGGLHLDPTRSLIEEYMNKEPQMRNVFSSMFNIYFEEHYDLIKNYMTEDRSIKRGSDEFYQEIIDVYFHNLKIVSSLEDEFDFKSFYYWQPSLATKKNLSKAEEKIIEKPNLRGLLKAYKKVNQKIEKRDSDFDNFNNLVDIFDDVEEQIYIDDSHKKPVGNKIIADRIASDITSYLDY